MTTVMKGFEASATLRRRIASRLRPDLLIDFVSDDAADGCAADGTRRAATRKNGPSDCADTCADRSALTLCRHTGTSTQAQQHCCRNRTDGKSLHRFHGITSLTDET